MGKILDGLMIKSPSDLHCQLKSLFDFPDYYGENLDALWDCLTAWIDTPITLLWINYSISESYLGGEAVKFKQLFECAAKEIEGFSFKVI